MGDKNGGKESADSDAKAETSKTETSSDGEKTEPAKKEETPAAETPSFSFQKGAPATTSASPDGGKPPSNSIFSGAGSTGGFTFGGAKPADSTASSSTTGFTFGGASSGGTASAGIFGGSSGVGGGFGSAGGFSFASKPSESAKSEGDGATADAEYQPPKNEVAEVKEEGAFYTKRCKLYFKKGETWQEKGLGNLHLKPCSGKTQLLIRADTNLGNILLNIMLSSSMPMGRQGKNNVSLMCVPNPPLDEK